MKLTDNIEDLQIGKAGEYLVCADLILHGHIAFPSEQGLPYDVVAEIEGKLFKVQVKTTRKPKNNPQRKSDIPVYLFGVGRNGSMGRNKKYLNGQVDIFALVALDTKVVAYINANDIKSTMIFRVPQNRGKYHDEKSIEIKKEVIRLKNMGFSCGEMASQLNMKISNIYKYSANVSLEQKGTNAGTYIDELTLDRCINAI